MKPNFSGHWVLDREASDFGFLAPATRRVDEIMQEGDAIRIVTQQTDTNGKTQVERRFVIGGPEVEVIIRNRPRKLRGWWEGDVLVVETASEVSGNGRRIEDRWTLDEGSSVVTIQRSHDMPGGNVRQTLVMRGIPA